MLELLDFWSPECGPCRRMVPILDQLTGIKIIKINTNEAIDMAEQYGITAIPTFIFLKNGQEVERVVGVQPLEKMQSLIKSHEN